MTPARFREILGMLCWTVPNLAHLLEIRVEVVQRWHDSLEPVPNNVAHWLQTLAKTPRASLPRRMIRRSAG